MSEFVREYGKALYDLAQEEALEDTLLFQVRALSALFSENPEYIRMLDSPDLPKEERESIAGALLDERAHEYIGSFLKLLIDRGRAAAVHDCFREYERIYYERHGILKAQVSSAAPLSDTQKGALLTKLETYTGKIIELHCQTDPELIGGVTVRIGGKLLDGSIRSHLDKLGKTLSDITI